MTLDIEIDLGLPFHQIANISQFIKNFTLQSCGTRNKTDSDQEAPRFVYEESKFFSEHLCFHFQS